MMTKCEEWHDDGETECLDCNHYDTGGNWKRWLICLFFRHDWHYVYSWTGYCQRCLRERSWKDY